MISCGKRKINKNTFTFQRESKMHSNTSVLKECLFLRNKGLNCISKQAKSQFPGSFWGFLGKGLQIIPPNLQIIEVHFIAVKAVPTKKFQKCANIRGCK